MFYKIFSIFVLFVTLTSCGREQQMLKPAMEEVVIIEPDTPEPAKEPIIHFPVEIDGIVLEDETYEVFTLSDAAINSHQFHEVLEFSKNYNLEFCGKREKALPSGNLDNYFDFLDEATANEFAEKVKSEYSEHLNTSKRVLPERFGWWGGIDLYPRCSGIGE